MITPNIKIQTETNRNLKKNNEGRRKNLIDSGIEFIFKKNSKITNEVSSTKSNFDNSYDHREERKWKPFESIKIYTDRRKSHDSRIGVDINGTQKKKKTHKPSPSNCFIDGLENKHIFF